MLAENCIEESLEGGYVENASTKFDSIPSISVSFIIKKNIAAEVCVVPTGLLFYKASRKNGLIVRHYRQ